jgi:mannose-6-phosphate isomerase-like protein (cupin superfamily)
MKRGILVALGLALAVTTGTLSAQNKAATYITAEEVQTVNQQPGTDRTIHVWDLGLEHFSVGIVKRGRTGGPPAGGAARGAAPGGAAAGAGRGAAAGAGGAGRANAAPAAACGEAMTGTPPADTPSGISHDVQTETYLITSGAGTMVTGGHIANGRKSGPSDQVTTELNGPSCSGAIMGSDVVRRDVKVGDIILIPAGVPHGWSTIPDHVEYLSFRPSGNALTPGYVHPSIKK